jgi:Adaptin N terminal region
MTEISDEFKVIIVEAIRSLCLKFPAKHASMLTFLSGVLRDEGGYDFKRAVVEAIFDMIKYIGESKEQALSHLCEFIEDCEFTKLSVRILHLLGMEGPKSPQPAKYIRFIYNRVVLENATVRAAAVSSLAKFGVNSIDAALRKSVNVLLNRFVLLCTPWRKTRSFIFFIADVWMMWMTKFEIAPLFTSRSLEINPWLMPMSRKVRRSDRVSRSRCSKD